MIKVTEEKFLAARQNLTALVLDIATRLEDTQGFTWDAVDAAPQTYEELTDAARHSYAEGVPLPVWSGASTDTIYLTAAANYAFRFWHDILHVCHYKDFSVAGELHIASLHVYAVAAEFGEGSLEAKLMALDTAGQVLYHMVEGGHVDNQLAYVRRVLDLE